MAASPCLASILRDASRSLSSGAHSRDPLAMLLRMRSQILILRRKATPSVSNHEAPEASWCWAALGIALAQPVAGDGETGSRVELGDIRCQRYRQAADQAFGT